MSAWIKLNVIPLRANIVCSQNQCIFDLQYNGIHIWLPKPWILQNKNICCKLSYAIKISFSIKYVLHNYYQWIN